MSEYKCFKCGKVLDDERFKKRLTCPYCGSKIVYKVSHLSRKLKAR